MRRLVLAAVALLALFAAGCDMLGMESPEKAAAAREADGKAIGAACRHAGRALEDCYVLNRRADKAAIFAGWRDMNDYMRENKIDAVKPVFVAQVAAKAGTETKADAKAGAGKSGDDEAKAKVGDSKDGNEPPDGKDSKS